MAISAPSTAMSMAEEIIPSLSPAAAAAAKSNVEHPANNNPHINATPRL